MNHKGGSSPVIIIQCGNRVKLAFYYGSLGES